MARTMSIDNTDIYRTVVDVLYRGNLDADAVQTTVYGPHDSKPSNKDYTSGWGAEPRRITKQQLHCTYSNEGGWNVEPGLEWHTYSVTYKNGGEGVNWDA